jgi:hypothetical protein
MRIHQRSSASHGYVQPLLFANPAAIFRPRNRGCSKYENQPQDILAGLVERVTYHNAENGFCVLRAKARGHRDVVTVDVRFTPNCWTYRRGAANRRFGPIATEPQIIRQSFRTRSLPAPLCFAAETGGICMGADVHCLEC